MEHIKKLLSSIYLGDRYCEKIEMKDDKISFQINCISRLKEGTKEWNYYSDEDIEHGCNVSDEAISTDIEIHIKAKKFYLFNPAEMYKPTEEVTIIRP